MAGNLLLMRTLQAIEDGKVDELPKLTRTACALVRAVVQRP
jgi:DNA-binding XRE family transcriptional regulator